MRTMAQLAESFLDLGGFDRPNLMLAHGGKGGSSRRRAEDDDDDSDDEDDDDDSDDEDDDDDSDDEDDDDLGELTDDELRKELRKARDSLSKSSGSNKAKRKRIARLSAELAEARKTKPAPTKTRTKADKDDDDPVDVDAIRTAATAEATKTANAKVVKAEARGALKAAGIPSAQVGRLVGMLKLEDIDVDDEGEVDEEALDEAIDELKKDWPQLFDASKKPSTRRRPRVAGDKDDDGKAGPRKKYSATELQVAAALGKKPSQL